ncbi:MAG TPA: ImmA/IrrE family metallo-endopeptidase [Pyrinomonadaceae bacterium]|nr:ImmA/IrrE family metallo-endopeptidase [Pyrinomonadaceae bacterium]
MRFLTGKIQRLGIEWNRRSLDEGDFYAICERHSVELIESPMRVSGFYFRAGGRDFIAMDTSLHGLPRLAVMFHELAHFLFHVPETGAAARFHGVGRSTRTEIEADIFALCALIPKVWIETRRPEDLIDEGFSLEMVTSRQKIHDRYGI